MRHLFAGLLLALLAACDASAAVGTAAAPFLDLAVGARNIAMGGAGVMERSATSAYWNPAGLSAVEGREASFTYGAFLPGVSYQYLAFAQKTDSGTFALSADYVSIAAIAKVDNTGLPTGESYKPWDGVFGLSYARPVFGFPVGATVKYITSSIDDVSAHAFAADFGVDLTPLLGEQKDIGIGAAVQNIGWGMRFVSKIDPLPTKVKVGAAWTPLADVLVAADVSRERGAGFVLNFGAEYLLRYGSSTLAARAGFEDDRTGLEGLSGLTAGLGFDLGRFKFDYAFAPMNQAGAAHRISLGLKF